MPDYKITTGLPQLPAGNADKDFNLVKPLYLALNALSQGLSISAGAVDFNQTELASQNQLGTLTTQNHRKLYALAAGVTLPFGAVVNLYISAGKIAARLADATIAGLPAHGIVNNPLGIDSGDFGEVIIIEGYTAGISGTTFGLYYYLSATGLIQAGQPVAAGTIRQGMGFGLGTAGFYMHISSYIVQN